MFDFLMPFSNILRSEPTFFVTFSVILGLMVGSFLNVVIHRLPKMMEREWHNNCLELQGKDVPEQPKYTIVTPRSACPKCGHNIGAMENIPIISYLILGGKCKGCKTGISVRYPLIEALTGALIGAVAYRYGYTYMTLFAWIFVLALITLTFIDLDTQLLPDDITLPLLWLGLLFNLNIGFTDLKSAALGAMLGYLILWSVFWLFKMTTWLISRFKTGTGVGKEGMGYGDFKLLGAIGAWFGWQLLPAVILLSSVVGAVIGIGMIIFKGKTGGTAIPFGPFLALGGIAALFFGRQLASFYLA
jgi:leader peptidase (prepilin peptidase) / N-methyltransferase